MSPTPPSTPDPAKTPKTPKPRRSSEPTAGTPKRGSTKSTAARLKPTGETPAAKPPETAAPPKATPAKTPAAKDTKAVPETPVETPNGHEPKRTNGVDPHLTTSAPAAATDTGEVIDVPELLDAPPRAEEPLPDDRFLNRELSWLDFNARVLHLAEDPATPLLERAKFLAIFARNLDEFYMVRVAGLTRRLQTGLAIRSTDGMTVREQLAAIADRTAELMARQSRCFAEDVAPDLLKAGIEIVRWVDLDDVERERMRDYFRDQVFPVLTPLAVDPAHPFPYISGLALNLAVVARDPDGATGEFFARVKIPNNVPRLVSVSRDGSVNPQSVRFLPLEDLIAAHLGALFSGMSILEHHVFRVTRNAELEVEDDRDEDLLQALERELARRRFGPPVRLEVADTISDHVLELLLRELDMDPSEVLRVHGLLDLSALWRIHDDIDRPELKDRPFVPATHPRFVDAETPRGLGVVDTNRRSVFAMLRDGDVLVHHPYHSFSTSVQRFIEQAALDPNVLAIKQTLYRTSGDSPVIDALVDAAEAGKQVVVIVEVKARFDEQANIGWARTLERAGCHVVYGLVGLKTHCKIALVVRQEGNQIRRYAHIGTGNYHPKTARLYEDLGLLTADPEIGADLTDLFNMLTGYSRQTAYRRLLVAPYGVRSGIVNRIEAQAALARAGEPSLIQLKLNSIVDEEVVDALYRASGAGVPIDLVIRGICVLRPGVPGLSQNIRVRSIVGRFLEHSRIYRFGVGDATEIWIGSADLMHRNLDRRVEALVRVTDATAQADIVDLLTRAMSEGTTAFELRPNGSWKEPSSGLPALDSSAQIVTGHLQEALLRSVVG